MDKIIITNKTDLNMETVVRAVYELFEYPIESDKIISYEDEEYYCYIKQNERSINFIFGGKGAD